MNKKFLKTMSAGMAALMLAGSLVGCGTNASNTKDQGSSGAELQGTVSLAGSTSMEKLCEAMSESFMEAYPDITVTVEYTGSGAGIESLTAGSIDIGNASRGLKDGEKEKGAVENVVAIDGIAVIVDKANAVTDLTTEQLADIYTGKVTNWSELGGSKKYLFLTNNSGMTPKELNQKLKRLGVDVPEEHFYTSALATAEFLKKQAPGCSAYVIGEAGLLNALYDAGVTMNDVNPDYVVIGEGRNYSLESLTKAVNLVLAGAKLIGANSDVSGNIEDGIAPACKALIAPVEMASGKQAYFCGKPNPLMMRTGLRLLDCHSEEAVIIGDRMDTDIIAGTESGVDTVLVLSGVSDRNTPKTFAYQPTMILDGVGCIASE